MSEQKICPTCGTEYPLSERFCPRDGTALRGSNPQGDLVGSVVAERYHIMKKLGEGGMGTVYLAEHVKMGRKAALKVMNPGMNQDADAIARFNREAANASRLSHPNICAIYDFGETSEGLIYLAMEFIEGVSLSSLIENSGALTPARAAAIIHQSADALQVAHDVGIVHRDLKPDNIMITKARDGSDNAKVVDFGIAKASSSDAQKVTKTGLVVGTPEYMSPEQLAGDKLDGRSDIYSLGLVAFNCLTGKLPFPSNSAQEAMIMRLTDQPKTLAEMFPGREWPDQLQAVMDRALARDAADRYQSAAEFGRDIAKAVENMPSSVAAEGATMVIGSDAAAAAAAARTAAAPAVPRTRVASGGGAAAAPAPAAPVAELPRKSGLPMPVIAAAATIVIGVGGWFVATQMGKGGEAAAPDSTAVVGAPTGSPQALQTAQPTGSGTPASGGSGNPGGGTPNPPAGRQGNTPANPAGATGRSAGGGAPTGGAPAPAAPDFDTWRDWTDPSNPSDANAEKAITAINAALPGLQGQDHARALMYLGMAQLITGRTTSACQTLGRARSAASGGLRSLIDPYFTMDGAPCK